MTKKQRADVIAKLQANHRYYNDYNQKETNGVSFMVNHGHPMTEGYLQLRAYYDTLRYACNASTRVIAYAHENERAYYSTPELEVTRHPSGIPDLYCHLWPNHEQWLSYLEKCAELDWPEGVEPELVTGHISVHTSNYKLIGSLFTHSEGYCAIREREVEKGRMWNAEIKTATAASALRCLKAIETAMKPYLIEKRTPGDDVEDNLPLPLAEKKFRLSGVSELTVDARTIHVPMLTLDAAGLALAERVSNGLLALCRQGYPYEGDVRQWLSHRLTKAALKKLDREFGALAVAA